MKRQAGSPPREGRRICVPGVRLIRLGLVKDDRGSLTVGEFRDLPFKPKRFFSVFDVPSEHLRGQHAHKRQHQFIICMKGSCTVQVNDGHNRDEVRLNAPNVGVYVPPMVWAMQFRHTRDSLLMVLSSGVYNPDDYIRDYEQYLNTMLGK